MNALPSSCRCGAAAVVTRPLMGIGPRPLCGDCAESAYESGLAFRPSGPGTPCCPTCGHLGVSSYHGCPACAERRRAAAVEQLLTRWVELRAKGLGKDDCRVMTGSSKNTAVALEAAAIERGMATWTTTPGGRR